MQYFTKKGFNQVFKKYQNQIGNYFYFDESGIKLKLVYIEYCSSICENGYHILFISEKINFTPIYQFMKLNKVEMEEKDLIYNFEDFETTSFYL